VSTCSISSKSKNNLFKKKKKKPKSEKHKNVMEVRKKGNPNLSLSPKEWSSLRYKECDCAMNNTCLKSTITKRKKII